MYLEKKRRQKLLASPKYLKLQHAVENVRKASTKGYACVPHFYLFSKRNTSMLFGRFLLIHATELPLQTQVVSYLEMDGSHRFCAHFEKFVRSDSKMLIEWLKSQQKNGTMLVFIWFFQTFIVHISKWLNCQYAGIFPSTSIYVQRFTIYFVIQSINWFRKCKIIKFFTSNCNSVINTFLLMIISILFSTDPVSSMVLQTIVFSVDL